MATTTGGAATGKITFEELLHKGPGQESYVCDQDCLVTIAETDTMERATTNLTTKIGDLFKKIEKSSSREIEQFYIGKTFINKKSTQFDAGNIDTWGMNGISDRWSKHKNEIQKTKTDPKTKKPVVTKKYYGKDGMIVIAVLTEAQVLKHRSTPVVSTELYTLALEQRLLHHYKISARDPRIANRTFGSGRCVSDDKPAFVLYVAFSLKTACSSTSLPKPNPMPDSKKKGPKK